MLYFSCKHARLPPVVPRPLVSDPHKRYKTSDILEWHRKYLNTLCQPSTQQQTSIHRLRQCLETWNVALNLRDVRDGLTNAQGAHLSNLLNDVFFGSAVPPFGFYWLNLQGRGWGGTSDAPWRSYELIAVEPVDDLSRKTEEEVGVDERRLNRLGTMLHEMLHVLCARRLVCYRCSDWKETIDKEAGHGGMWMEMARNFAGCCA
jgi:hypothetical protein